MLTYRSSDGETYLDQVYEGIGYSGAGYGRNNPDMEDVVGVGPIPRGLYRIGKPDTNVKTGPLTFVLIPDGHNAHGRSGFLIHGDNITHNASHGCVILGRCVREAIAKANETVLNVI